MREAIEAVVGNHSIYSARRQEFDTGKKIPFRISPRPLYLSKEQKIDIQNIGSDISCYFHIVDEMYVNNMGGVRNILDTGKPQIFLADQLAHYLFARPDLIITEGGFSICEVETSPFGLALAEILNQAYQNKGFETMVDSGAISEQVRQNTPIEGNIVYSKKTQAYSGQITFLADKVFSGDGRHWESQDADNITLQNNSNIYRGFYLNEYLSDPAIKILLDRQITNNDNTIPSPTPYMEEKAILSLIYDKRFEEYLRIKLGVASFKHLKTVIPPTWIVGQEQFFAPGMPNNISSSIELANLSKSKRAYVLKSSGFSENSSWKEGVHFLQRESTEKTLQLLHEAETDKTGLHIVQEFKKGLNIPLNYESEDEKSEMPMTARIRLTPYFAVTNNGQDGKLIAIKATGCENTDFIHASSTSINTAVN